MAQHVGIGHSVLSLCVSDQKRLVPYPSIFTIYRLAGPTYITHVPYTADEGLRCGDLRLLHLLLLPIQ